MSPTATSLQPERSTSWLPLGIVILAVWVFFYLALSSVIDDSPTMDEQNHIARGIAFLQTGDPRFSLEHPPLVNSLSALPLLTMPRLNVPTDHASWEQEQGWYEFARQLLWVYNEDVDQIVFLARLPIIFLTLMLAAVAYRFARGYWRGMGPGLIAFLLLLFEPNVMAHGRYATTDMGAVFFTFLATVALFGLWYGNHTWSWRRWAWAALVMGLAFSSKLSALAFVPVWFLMALFSPWPEDGSGPRQLPRNWLRPTLRRELQLFSAGVASLLVIWAAFGFQWGQPALRTEWLLSLNDISLPMPTFWAGLEQIALLGIEGRMNAFMLGQFSESGFLSYFPVAFLTKSSLPFLALSVVALVALLANRHTRRRALYLLLPTLAVFFIMSVAALNIGYRHVLPALPYLVVLISGLGSPLLVVERERAKRVPVTRALAWTGVAAASISLLLIHPHYLSFFNQAVGGPANGYRILIDSNLDWGQDLKRLAAWMDANDVEQVKLAWFGSADPAHYGIGYQPLPGIGRDPFFGLWWSVPFDTTNPEPGIYAISATNLWEVPLREEEKTVFAWFRGQEPDARVGYSILIYDVR